MSVEEDYYTHLVLKDIREAIELAYDKSKADDILGELHKGLDSFKQGQKGTADAAKHYQHGKKQPIEIMRLLFDTDMMYGFLLGNAIKYVLRADYKGTRDEDMEKACQYILWCIDWWGENDV